MTILLQDKPGPARPDVRGLPATFGSLGVPAPLVAPLDAAGITVPFPIQAAALSDALAERDILGKAAPAPVRRSAIHSRSSRGAAGRVVADTTRQLWEELAALSAPVRRRALDRCWTSCRGSRLSDLERWRKGPVPRGSGPSLVKSLDRVAEIGGLGLAGLGAEARVLPRRLAELARYE